MLTVTQQFKDALKSSIKDVSGYIVLQDGTELRPEGDLQSYTIDSIGDLFKTSMSKITVILLGEHHLEGNAIDVYYGVYYDDQYNYVLRGKFQITEAAYKKDTETTVLTGYDNMMQFQVGYTPVGAYPSTLYEYLQALCSLAGVVLENTEINNGTLIMEEDYYANVEEATARDVLEDICEASASLALINPQGNLELRQVEDNGEVLTYSELIQYKIEDYWGSINSLVLSRQPQNDDVFIRDDEDINQPTTRNVLDLTKFTVTYSAEDD